ncbi:Cupredoxin [Mycena albidolilacea]|uniref:Cupredoxin n=1 Tax=Mycena albidolilacea TaxID=1033008 RepID=A0AAD6ZQ63_9AGAR|nr:Cupredoxin [Mycena albidolilacea]
MAALCLALISVILWDKPTGDVGGSFCGGTQWQAARSGTSLLASMHYRGAEIKLLEPQLRVGSGRHSIDGPGDTRRTRRHIPRKRVSAIAVLVLGLQPMDRDPDTLLGSDVFSLNPKFDFKAGARTRIYNWTVSAVPVPGANRTRMVNGRSPGPLIEANADDRILVYVTNGLAMEGTSIHWYLPFPQFLYSSRPRNTYTHPGTHTSNRTPPSTTAPLASLSAPSRPVQRCYITSPSEAGRGRRGGSDFLPIFYFLDSFDGLFGPLIVHAPSERANSPDYTAEHVLTLSDVYGTEAGGLFDKYRAATSVLIPVFYFQLHPMETVPEVVPDCTTINGRRARPHADADADVRPRAYGGGSSTRRPRQETRNEDDNPGFPTGGTGGAEEGYAEVEAKAWTTTRLRLINAGTFDPLRVSVDNHALTIIEADGTPLAPVRVRDLVLHPAQRYNVLVTREGRDSPVDTFWIRARMVEDKFAYINPHMQPEARAILRYKSASALKPLPTTHPGPPPDNKLNTWWYKLPTFDEWKLRPASSSSFASTDAAALENTNTGAFRNTTNVLSIPFILSIQRMHELYWCSFINELGGAVPRGPIRWRCTLDLRGQLIATILHEQTVDFIITNLDDGDHPFHLHGYAVSAFTLHTPLLPRN